MEVAESVKLAVAELARAYAGAIDEATHVPLGLAKALRLIEAAVETAVKFDPIAYAGAPDAYDKIAAALSTVTVLGTLGPKLLDTYKTLAPPAKAQSADKSADGGASNDELANLRRRRAARGTG